MEPIVKNKRNKKTDVDMFQQYISMGATLHPVTYMLFIEKLTEMEKKQKLCLLPSMILQLYADKFKQVV